MDKAVALRSEGWGFNPHSCQNISCVALMNLYFIEFEEMLWQSNYPGKFVSREIKWQSNFLEKVLQRYF